MANSDIFAPPSDAEIQAAKKKQVDLFAPPSDQEIASAKSSSDRGQQGLGSAILELLGAGARKLDSYTGAPMRAGIGAAQDGENPLSAAWKQVGENPDLAPSGEAIVEKAGVPHGAGSKVLGFGMDMAANPLNFTGPIAAGASKLGEIAGAAAKAVPYVGDVAEGLAAAPKSLAAKAVGTLSGKPSQAIKIYSADPGAVNTMINSSGGELSTAADAIKTKVLDSIKATKAEQRGVIENTLANNPSQVPAAPILEKLQKAKSALNPHYNPSDIAQIDEMMNAVQSTAKDGALNLKDLFDTKSFLQTRAEGSFVKDGQLFSSGEKASRAANDARATAVKMLHESAPEIAHADSVYSDLHALDDKMSSALLGTGKSENVLASAGGATDKYKNVHYSMLKKLGEITGYDALPEAQTLYSAKSFAQHPNMAGEAFRTGMTFGQGVKNSQLPPRLINLLQGIASQTENPIPQPAYAGGNAIDRRISNKK